MKTTSYNKTTSIRSKIKHNKCLNEIIANPSLQHIHTYDCMNVKQTNVGCYGDWASCQERWSPLAATGRCKPLLAKEAPPMTIASSPC